MLNEETRRKLRLMNIGEFIDAIEEQQQDPQTIALPFEERFQQLTDSVYQQKYNDKVHRLIKLQNSGCLKLIYMTSCTQTIDH